MASENELRAIVDKLIARGESDEDIQFVIDDYRTANRLPSKAQREANMSAQAGINTDPVKAENASKLETLKSVGRGVKNAVFSMFDPRTYVEMSKMASDAMMPTSPEAVMRTVARARGMVDFGKRVLSGDPEAGGEALAGLVAPEVAARVLPRVPGAMAATGRGMERMGKNPMVQKAAEMGGVIEAVSQHSPAGVATGMAIGAAPSALEAGGRLLQSGAERLGATPRVKMPVANAGGRLVKTKPPTLDEEMATALKDVSSQKPEAVELKPYVPADEPLRMQDVTGVSRSGANIYAERNGRLGAATLGPPEPAPMAPPGRLVKPTVPADDPLVVALQEVSSAPTPTSVELPPQAPPPTRDMPVGSFSGVDPSFYIPKPKAAAPSPIEQQLLKDVSSGAPEAAAEPLSPIAQQLMDSLELRRGQEAAPELLPASSAGTPIDALPMELLQPSRSRTGTPSATPGLTEADVVALGKDPSVPITHLTFDEIAKLAAARRARHASRYSDAVSEAAAKRSVTRQTEPKP